MRRSPFFVCEVAVEGLSLERMLQCLQREGLPLLSVKRESARRLRMVCYETDLPAIEALLSGKGWSLREASPRGLAKLRDRLLRHKALFLAAAICTVCVGLGLQLIWGVRVENAGAYQGDIAVYLAEQGARVGGWARGMDLERLESGLFTRYPSLVWASVSFRGPVLIADCRFGEFAEVRSAQPGDLLAVRDGVVLSVLVQSGTARVSAGDTVRAGQVLIAGVERGAGDTAQSVRAAGRVMARVWESAEALVSLYQWVGEPTGRAREWSRICTPWGCWPADATEAVYLTYDREIEATPVVGCVFPVWRELGRDAEVALCRQSRSVETARAEAAQAAERILRNRLHMNEIIDKWADYCMIEGGKVSAIVTAELHLDIGVNADEWNGGTPIDPNAGIP